MSSLLPVLNKEDKEALKNAEACLKRLTKSWKHDIALLTICKFAQLLINAMMLISIAGLLADMVLHPAADQLLFRQTRTILLLMLARISMTFILSRLNASFTGKILLSVRASLLAETADRLFFAEKTPVSGEIPYVFCEKTAALVPYFCRYLPQLLLAVLVPIAMIAYIFSLNWICGAIMLVTLPVIPVYMVLIGKGTATASREQWYNLAHMGGYFNDRLKGLSTLSLYGQLENESGRVKQASENYGRSAMDVLRLAFLSSAVLEFFSTIIIAGIAIFIGLSLLHYLNWGSVTDFSLSRSLIILMLVPEFLLMLKTLGTFYHDRSTALGAILHLQEEGFFTGATPNESASAAVQVQRSTSNAVPATPHIQLHQLAFGYPSKSLLFRGLDLSIPPGSKIQLQGANGTGKSTLIALLMGFITPVAGSVHLDGHAVAAINGYHRFFGWVGQHPRIFKGTLRANLLMASHHSDAYILDRIAAYFDRDTFFSAFPQGLDTLIADDGRSVSGGERQKIALLRILLKDAPVLLLDEPFTHLDQQSAAQFLSALRLHAAGKTIILVTHDHTLNLDDFKTIKLHADLA